MKYCGPPAKISIVLPTYNVERYIDRALTSCTSQSMRDIEIIVVDDRGTDTTMEKVYAWQKEDDRIKIIRNPKNLGTYHARRLGVEHASSDYIIFLDPDDELDRDAARLIYNIVSKDSPDIIFYGHTNSFQVTRKRTLYHLPPNGLHGEILAKSVVSARTLLGTPGKAYSRSHITNALEKLKIPTNQRLVYGEDTLLLFAAMVEAKSTATINRPLYLYHTNDESITNTSDSIKNIRNSHQIDDVIIHITKYTYTPQNTYHKKSVEYARQKIIDKLSADKYFLLRHTKDKNNKSIYLNCISKRIFTYRKWKDIIRLSLYLGTAGKIRL